MRRTLPLLLSSLLAMPFSARAQDDDDAAADDEETKPKKKKTKGDATDSEGGMRFDNLELTPKRKKKATGKPDPDEKDDQDAKADEKPDDSVKSQILEILDDDKPLSGYARHRYGYLIGGGFLVTGLAFAYSSQGEAKRAETIGTAREASQALENARIAATANVAYGMAIAALAVTLLFEILRSLAEKASLTFHF